MNMNFHKYILIQKKEITGTDIKAFINDETLKVNKKNKPRIFANTIKLNKKIKYLTKVFLQFVTIEKMINVPPWTIQATKDVT